MPNDDGKAGRPIDRRSLLQLMSALGGTLAMPAWPAAVEAQDAAFSLANPDYARIYNNTSGFYFKDEVWTKETRPRLTWPTPGQPVHDIRVVIPSDAPDTVDAFRKWSADAQQIGIRYQVEQASQARWLELINKHQHGDIELHPSILRPERIDD